MLAIVAIQKGLNLLNDTIGSNYYVQLNESINYVPQKKDHRYSRHQYRQSW